MPSTTNLEAAPVLASNVGAEPAQSRPAPMPAVPELGFAGSVQRHWPEYSMEAAGLGVFMISACVFGALYEFPGSPVHQAIKWQLARRLLMGLSMGLTAIAIIYSPWGKQSGAHINPSVTLTFLRLGKIKHWDAILYVISQFAGAALGVAVIAIFLGRELADPAVDYVVTVPGARGPWVALAAEYAMALGMM